jgi:hypothetical protein
MNIEETLDASIKHPSTIIIAGQTGSGKSYFTHELIKNKKTFTPIPPKHVIFIYKEWQSLYDKLKTEKLVDEFVCGMPDDKDIKKLMEKYKKMEV